MCHESCDALAMCHQNRWPFFKATCIGQDGVSKNATSLDGQGCDRVSKNATILDGHFYIMSWHVDACRPARQLSVPRISEVDVKPF